MIDEEAVDELFEVVEDMSTVLYFPMVLNGSKGGSKRSVILSAWKSGPVRSFDPKRGGPRPRPVFEI